MWHGSKRSGPGRHCGAVSNTVNIKRKQMPHHLEVGQMTVVFELLEVARTIRRVHVRLAKLIRRYAGLAILAGLVA